MLLLLHEQSCRDGVAAAPARTARITTARARPAPILPLPAPPLTLGPCLIAFDHGLQQPARAGQCGALHHHHTRQAGDVGSPPFGEGGGGEGRGGGVKRVGCANVWAGLRAWQSCVCAEGRRATCGVVWCSCVLLAARQLHPPQTHNCHTLGRRTITPHRQSTPHPHISLLRHPCPSPFLSFFLGVTDSARAHSERQSKASMEVAPKVSCRGSADGGILVYRTACTLGAAGLSPQPLPPHRIT